MKTYHGRALAAICLLIVLTISTSAQERKPFWKQKKFYAGLLISAVGVGIDHYGTGHAERHGYREGNIYLRRSNGELNAGRLWMMWAGINAALIACEVPKEDDRWEWAAFSMRGAFGVSSGVRGIRNLRLPPLTPSQ